MGLRTTALVLLLLATGASGQSSRSAQTASSPQSFHKLLNEKCPKILAKEHVPGLAIAVIEHGKVAFTADFGFADSKHHIPVTDETLFNIASVSKSVSTWGIMHLVETGTISLDSPVNPLLRRWQLPQSSFDSSQVTVRRILSHTAGLSVPAAPWFPATSPLPSLVDVLTGKAGGKPVEIVQPPGRTWQYSGGGFEVLQLLVEDQTHQDFAAYMNHEVFDKLGMHHSTFDPTKDMARHIAISYDKEGKQISPYRLVGVAAGGLFTTIADFGRFVSSYTQGDALPGRDVITAASLSAMATPVAEVKLGNVNVTGARYGLGHGVLQSAGNKVSLYHSGGNPGTLAYFIVSLSSGNGLALVCNSDNGVPVMTQVIQWWSNQYGEGIPPLY
jgi:CubicO group peptidase (beta-lactamase class C family)